METTNILEALRGLQIQVRTRAGSSSRSAPDHNLFEAARQVNDHVYEICKPEGRPPSVEIVFFHGLQLKDYSSNDAHLYISTWVSRGNRPELWLKWLQEEHFPDCRILVISYDSSLKRKRGDDRGRNDMYVTSENLIRCLTARDVQVGENGCPVVLVGHCLGGLVMKQLCVAANAMLSLNWTESVDMFLRNVKGFFTYASPHCGSELVDALIDSTQFSRGRLFEDLTILNQHSARRREDFRMLRNKHSWMSFGVGESVEVTLDLGSLKFTGIVVEEASARCDVDGFYTIGENHFNICRPYSTKSGSFKLLSDFISTVMEQHRAKRSTRTEVLANPKMVGLKAAVKNVLAKLSDTSPRLGIVGFGGIGKTTLAKAIYEKISGEFHYACFLEEIKTKMTGKDTVDVLKMKIKEKLQQNGQDVSKYFDWSKLKGMKVLIILDDAKFESHVSVMTAEDDFSEKSRVIVTSRTQKFLRKQKFVIHEAEVLGLEDSKRLFCQHVFGQSGVPPAYKHYESRVTDFANKCGGLPLALEVAGSFLSKEVFEPEEAMWDDVTSECNQALWDDALKKLSQAEAVNGEHEDGLWSLLGVIIDNLVPPEREMFKDVATCFYGMPLHDVKKDWKACSWTGGTSEIGWQNLLDRCLVKTDIYGNITMHELLRNLGRNRAGNSRVRTSHIRKLSRLHEQDKAKVKVLILTLSGDSWFRKHRDEHDSEEDDIDEDNSIENAFDEDNSIEDAFDEDELEYEDDLSKPDEEPDFPRKLETNEDDSHEDNSGEDDSGEDDKSRCDAGNRDNCVDAVELSGLKELQILWLTFVDLPSEPITWDFQTLRSLSFRFCSFDVSFFSGRQLRALERLIIQSCPLKSLPESTGQLTHLETKRCNHLKPFPCIAHLTALKHLEIRRHGLEALPCIGKLTALETFTIGECESLTELPSLRKVKALRRIDILFCCSLTALPSTLWQLSALEHLRIHNCPLGELSESISQLTALRHLEIHFCHHLKALPSTIGDLSALERLEIEECESLTELPEGVGQLQALRYLVLSSLPCKTLPDTLGNLHKLEILSIHYMEGLQKVPDILGQLTALRELHLSGCENLVTPPKLPEKFRFKFITKRKTWG